MAYIQPIAQSESKARLMAYLQLDSDLDEHRQIYARMKEEATSAARYLMFNRQTLTTAARDDPAVQPPYSCHHISETAMNAETMRIYHNASRETRAYYDLAHDRSGPVEENWLIKWMLWHVFRYRDGRNKPKGRRAMIDVASPSSLENAIGHNRVEHESQTVRQRQTKIPQQAEENQSTTPTIIPSSLSDRRQVIAVSQPDPALHSSKALLYDPVRDLFR